MIMHSRNRHQGHYDFKKLTQSCPELSLFVSPNTYGDRSIDFSNPKAVKTLNRALLMSFYGLLYWDIPEGFLCPPVPGRGDMIHSGADLLAASCGGEIPRGKDVRVLDVGVGANLIYPIIGRCEYGWSFVGSDVDSKALAAAEKIIHLNEKRLDGIELRLQKQPSNIFRGVIGPEERFELSICNPPFHSSLEEAQKGNLRKRNNLGLKGAPKLNFGGQGAELWCAGGEVAFIQTMIEESAEFSKNVFWFTTLVSKEAHLPALIHALKKIHAFESRIIEMAQGQKKSRLIAWTFLSQKEQDEWSSALTSYMQPKPY